MPSRVTLAAMLGVATALWALPAAAQLDQAITRSQSSNIQRAIQNNARAPRTAHRPSIRRQVKPTVPANALPPTNQSDQSE